MAVPILNCVALLWAAVFLGHRIHAAVLIEPFELSDVQLHDDTYQAKAAALNTEYLFELDPERMLLVFRRNADLPAPGVPFYGTWEDPGCELRGHFVGHYLSALSFVVMNTGNVTARKRLDYMVSELGKVQEALGDGYLSAFPSEHFDRVEALKGVWAPYYVIHKIMAGLLDAHALTGNTQAGTMVEAMAGYFLRRIDKVVVAKGEEYWQRTLDTEFGGMNDIMYRLYARTRNPDHLRMAQMFDKKRFYGAMKANQDVLGGLHANTHLAQVVGFAERFDAMGDTEASTAVRNFFDMVSGPHAYATGGSNDKEFWFEPGILGESVSIKNDAMETQEICTQYNVLKIARSLFRWTGDVRLADFYERALVNGILGVTRLTDDDVHVGAHHHDHHGDDPHGADHHHHHHMALAGSGHMHLVSSAHPKHYFRSKEHRLLQQDEDEADHSAGEASATADFSATGTTGRGLPANDVLPAHRRPFTTRFQDYWGFTLDKMPNSKNATNVPGTPGVYLYLLTLGAGMSKADNYHHWGYPMHSFWCCYGTAIESFAKLADSIYFHSPAKGRDPAKLYINQLVSSRLSWKAVGVVVHMNTSMYAPGPAATALLDITLTKGKSAAFTLMLRVPEWAVARHTVVKVNGVEWRRCPSTPAPASYCSLIRTWKQGDRVEVHMGLSYWLKALPDRRTEWQSLKALMMGPFVMAGLTHDTRHLVVEEAKLSELMSEPGDHEELVSIQASWNSSLYLRHDLYHGHMSAMEDGGDAIDATFRIVRGCEHGRPLTDSGTTGSSSSSSSRALVDSGDNGVHSSDTQSQHEALHHMQHQMRVGLHDDSAILLESMNFPGFYLGFNEGDTYLTLTQPAAPGGQHPSTTGSGAASSYFSGASHSAHGTQASEHHDFCRGHQFMVRPGLDGTPHSVSFESVAQPGHFVSAYQSPDGGARRCEDIRQDCDKAHNDGLCVSEPEVYGVQCRRSCRFCNSTASALTLQQLPSGTAQEARAAASFKLAQPLAPRYPPGSKVVTAHNRRYLVAPLGNLVDERYTVYFNIVPPASPGPGGRS